jgi:NitT/TauT family transport system substrate-binding protein
VLKYSQAALRDQNKNTASLSCEKSGSGNGAKQEEPMLKLIQDRRSLCVMAAIALSAGLVGLASPASADAKLRVGKAVPEAFSFVPLDVGIRTGIFKKNGLDIESIAFHGDAKMQQAMAADGIDLALGSGPGMAFIMKGSPVKAIAAMAGPPLLLTIVVRPDGPKTTADLKGKKVGVSTLGSLTYWLTKETSRREGWGPEGINAVPMGATKGQIAALSRGDIDGFVTDIATALTLQEEGKARILVRFGKLKDFHIHVIFATNKIIKEHPAELSAFLKGWFETIDYMRKHKAETVKIASEVMHKSMKISEQTYDELMPMFSDNGKFNPKAMTVLTKSYVELKILKEVPDPKKLYTEEFLPK